MAFGKSKPGLGEARVILPTLFLINEFADAGSDWDSANEREREFVRCVHMRYIPISGAPVLARRLSNL